jgi:hypothetical protein
MEEQISAILLDNSEWATCKLLKNVRSGRIQGTGLGRGIFVTGCARTPFQKFFLRMTQAGTAFQDHFPWHWYN